MRRMDRGVWEAGSRAGEPTYKGWRSNKRRRGDGRYKSICAVSWIEGGGVVDFEEGSATWWERRGEGIAGVSSQYLVYRD